MYCRGDISDTIRGNSDYRAGGGCCYAACGHLYQCDCGDLGAGDRIDFQGEYTVEAGYQVVPSLLSLDPVPTAIMAPNDQSAIGVLRGLHEAGVSVPDQMSVTGFDDILSSRYVTPTLTTAHVPVRELGELAVTTLLARIEGRDRGVEERMPVEIVVRRSSGPPRMANLVD